MSIVERRCAKCNLLENDLFHSPFSGPIFHPFEPAAETSPGPRCPDCGGKCHLYLPTVAYCDKCAARFELNELEDFAQFFRPVAAHAPKVDAPEKETK